jgi:hypothetical protein
VPLPHESTKRSVMVGPPHDDLGEKREALQSSRAAQ